MNRYIAEPMEILGRGGGCLQVPTVLIGTVKLLWTRNYDITFESNPVIRKLIGTFINRYHETFPRTNSLF